MGYPNGDLILPAILYMNPGKTREEISKLMDKVKASPNHIFKNSDPWEIYGGGDSDLHMGLEGLTSLLHLNWSKEFRRFRKSKKDENGLEIESPEYIIDYDTLEAKVIVHEKNIIKEPKRIEGNSLEPLKINDIFKEVFHYPIGDEGIVTKIYSEECYTQDNLFNGQPVYTYDMEIKPIIRIYEVEKSNSREELWKKWPQFNPINRFDWSREKGSFGSVGRGAHLQAFNWIMKNGKYYLDEKSFNIMPASISSENHLSVFDNRWGYTDIIINIEAIKNKAWKIFSYEHDKNFNNDFLRDFPSAKKAYDKAVWDSHTSIYAKNNNMSTSDLLKFRISANGRLT